MLEKSRLASIEVARGLWRLAFFLPLVILMLLPIDEIYFFVRQNVDFALAEGGSKGLLWA